MSHRYPVTEAGDFTKVVASVTVTPELQAAYEAGAEFTLEPLVLQTTDGRRLIGFSLNPRAAIEAAEQQEGN